MKNVKLQYLKLNAWRKIAIGTWKTVGDPSVYGSFDLDVTDLLEKIKNSEKSKPTITAIVSKAIAETFKRYPKINGMIRFGSIYTRNSVKLFLQTAVDDAGAELSGLTIDNAENKSLAEISEEIKSKAKMVREDKGGSLKPVRGLFSLIPTLLVRMALNFSSFITYTLNINLSFLGIPKDPFGSIMITSVGMLGLDLAFAPLVPYSRVPILIAIGAVREQPVVKDGKIVIAKLLKLNATFDHRFMDGLYAAKMVKAMRQIIETSEGHKILGY